MVSQNKLSGQAPIYLQTRHNTLGWCPCVFEDCWSENPSSTPGWPHAISGLAGCSDGSEYHALEHFRLLPGRWY